MNDKNYTFFLPRVVLNSVTLYAQIVFCSYFLCADGFLFSSSLDKNIHIWSLKVHVIILYSSLFDLFPRLSFLPMMCTV